ncbi:MAG: hypothetical protein U0894_08000 [Pirellulales bacterium]
MLHTVGVAGWTLAQALGDMGAHIIDHPVWALETDSPTSVESRTTLDGSVIDGKPMSIPSRSPPLSPTNSPARGNCRGRMTWYDGGLMPPTPALMPAGKRVYTITMLFCTLAARESCTTVRMVACRGYFPAVLHEEAAKVAKTMVRSQPLRRMASGLQGARVLSPTLNTLAADRNRPAWGLSLRAPGMRLEWDSPEVKSEERAQSLAHSSLQNIARSWTL